MTEHDNRLEGLEELEDLVELKVRVDRLELNLKLLKFGMENLQDAMNQTVEGMRMLTNLVGDVLTALGAPEAPEAE